jgi:hypothetical protein
VQLGPAAAGLGVDEGGELDEGVGAAAGAADEALEGGRALGVGEGFEGLVPALDEGRDALAAAGEGLAVGVGEGDVVGRCT